MTGKEKIKKICKSFPYEKYEKIDLNSLAAYTIKYLQENEIFLNFENTAVALFLMFPKKFSMIGYEEYPDTNRINRTVNLQLRPRYTNLAFGDPKKGYILTEKGKAVADQVNDILIKEKTGIKLKKSDVIEDHSKRTITPEIQFENRVLNTSLYQKYVKDKEVEIEKIEIYEFLESSPYTPSNMLRDKLNSLKKLATSIGNKEGEDFLKWVEKRLLPKIGSDRYD